jgi:hypothetical protein
LFPDSRELAPSGVLVDIDELPFGRRVFDF